MRFVSTEALDSILIIYVHMPQCVRVGLYFYGLNFFFLHQVHFCGLPIDCWFGRLGHSGYNTEKCGFMDGASLINL